MSSNDNNKDTKKEPERQVEEGDEGEVISHFTFTNQSSKILTR